MIQNLDSAHNCGYITVCVMQNELHSLHPRAKFVGGDCGRSANASSHVSFACFVVADTFFLHHVFAFLDAFLTILASQMEVFIAIGQLSELCEKADLI